MDLEEIIKEYPGLQKLFSGITNKIVFNKELFKAKSIVVQKNQKIDRVMVLCSGDMIVFNEYESGDVVDVQTDKIRFIGEVELLSGLDTFVCSVIAITDCVVITMNPVDFINWFNEDNNLARELARQISIRNCTQASEIGAFKYYNINYRTGIHLLGLALPLLENESKAEIHITKVELAHRVAASERMIYRVIRELKNKNILTTKYCKIIISRVQIQYLEKWLQEQKKINLQSIYKF